MDTKRMMIIVPAEIHQRFKTVALFKNSTMTDILLQKIKEVITEEEEKGNIPEVRKQA